MGLILVLCQVLSLLSVYRLNVLADYEKLWKASQKTPCFSPIVHRTLIHKFVQIGNPDKLREVLDDCTGEEVMRQSPSGVAPTSLAIRTGRFDCLRILCEKEANLDELDGSGMTPTILAFKRKSVACMEVLVEYGAPGVDTVSVTTSGELFNLVLTTNESFEGNDSMDSTMELEGLELDKLSKLLKKGGVSQVANAAGTTPIHAAIEEDNVSLLEKMLQAGLSPN